MMDPMDTADIVPLALMTLAVARVTRLITSDRITEAPRNAVIRRLDPDGLFAYLLVCSWCSSVYVGAAGAAAGALAGWWSWTMAVPAALAFSYVAGFLASREGE
jgi:hypothetical protein